MFLQVCFCSKNICNEIAGQFLPHNEWKQIPYEINVEIIQQYHSKCLSKRLIPICLNSVVLHKKICIFAVLFMML